jgi:hypothetical protein
LEYRAFFKMLLETEETKKKVWLLHPVMHVGVMLHLHVIIKYHKYM